MKNLFVGEFELFKPGIHFLKLNKNYLSHGFRVILVLKTVTEEKRYIILFEDRDELVQQLHEDSLPIPNNSFFWRVLKREMLMHLVNDILWEFMKSFHIFFGGWIFEVDDVRIVALQEFQHILVVVRIEEIPSKTST